MTKEVLLKISGLHYETAGAAGDDENEPIEVITPATYYFKNNKHYVIYDEVVEGMPGVIRNKVRIMESGKNCAAEVDHVAHVQLAHILFLQRSG